MAAPRAPFDPTDPDLLTPEQRRDELAGLLAAGAKRLLRARSTPAPQIDPDSSPNRLDSPPEQSVYGRPRG
jgi:hypothetical protein